MFLVKAFDLILIMIRFRRMNPNNPCWDHGQGYVGWGGVKQVGGKFGVGCKK